MATKKQANSTYTGTPIPIEIGKIPPQAVELEDAVLGAIMLEKDAISSIIDFIKPESFYKDANQKVFRAIQSLFMQEQPIDMLTVTEALKKEQWLDEVGGQYYVSQLTNRVASAAHIEFHARIVAQKYIQRELIRVASDIHSKAFDDSIDVNDLLDYSESQLFEITQRNVKKEIQKIDIILRESIKKIEEASKREDHLSGVPSGFTALDRLTSGWQKSDLIVIAARPSMGKTALVLSMTRNMAIAHKRPIAIFSLEMASEQLVNRLISIETELPSDKIRNGRLSGPEWRQLDTLIKPLEQAPVYIDDSPGISVFELRAKCRRMKKQFNIEAVIIDYLQLMTGPPETKGNREQEVSIISRSLKGIAKELNIPVIALSQLNRSVESRTGNKRPQLSDLRESGAIEQDADLVLFIHRPEKYGILQDDDGNSTVGIAEIILAKHRNGATGDVKLRFRDTLAKFVDLDEFDLSPEPAPQVYTVGSRMNTESDFDVRSSGISSNANFENEETPF